MENNVSVSEDVLFDLYVDALSVKRAIEGLASLIDQKGERFEKLQTEDLAILLSVAEAAKALADNHVRKLGEASGYE